jgi:protein-disulfide isomerase
MTQDTKILLIIGSLTLVILTVGMFFLSKNTTPVNDYGPVDSKLLVKDESYKISTDSATVTIVEFGDYECPACGAAHPILKQVLSSFTKDVNFVFRHFPLPQHLNALEAAEAAESAGEQGKYWQMHDLLYENQDVWPDSSNALEIFTGYAKQLNLNMELFNASMSSNKFVSKINADKKDGEALGVNSTPTFYVNGTKLKSFSFSEFKQKIEEKTVK